MIALLAAVALIHGQQPTAAQLIDAGHLKRARGSSSVPEARGGERFSKGGVSVADLLEGKR